MEYEPVIGLEVHCQLSTNTKIFCGCPARLEDGKSVADVEVNSNTCPICAGHPGTLPVLNETVLEYAVRAGLATNCEIRNHNVFARKNYFYPDLPKGYQISQFEKPICENGHLVIETEAGPKRITIQRIHMEEDAGKNVHMSGFSLVNLNRAGVPLIEIVSGPDLKTAQEASAYLKSLHAVVTYLGICDGNMQEGNFRCDANVSVMPKGSKTYGTRAEIKNVNSFRFVEKAIEFEIHRQIELLQSGERVIQETRGYDSAKNQTYSMRSKETADDYRYFPDPDLISVRLENAWIEKIKTKLPELPEEKKQRFVSELGLSSYDAGVLTGSQANAQFFEKVLERIQAKSKDSKKLAKTVANLMTGEVARLINDEAKELNETKLIPEHLADIAMAQSAGEISSTAGKQVLGVAWNHGGSVSQIIEKEGLKQVSDVGALEAAIQKVIDSNPSQVEQFRGGKDKLLGFFVGQVMKVTSGKANPGMVQELILKKLKP